MAEFNSDADEAETVTTPPTGRKPRYPRPGWLALVRFLLLISGFIGPAYVWVFVQAVIHHTLHTVDRDLLTWHSILLVVVLTAGSIWAIFDTVREWKAEDQQRKAERRIPYAVRDEREAREKLTQARARGDQRAEGEALRTIGFCLNEQERYAEAETYLTQALALARTLGDRLLEERNLCALAHPAFARGNLDEVEALYRQALAVALTLTPLDFRSPRATEDYVLDEVANIYEIAGKFLAEYRDNRTEGCHMLAEAAARYQEVARHHEMAAQAHRRGGRRRAFEDRMRQRALALEQDVRDLQRQYGCDGE